MTISDRKVAIIGTGTIGSSLAANLAAGGQDFRQAGPDQQAARKIAVNPAATPRRRASTTRSTGSACSCSPSNLTSSRRSSPNTGSGWRAM